MANCLTFFSVKECKEKWKNIRTVFRRHINTKPPSGSGTGTTIKKEYYMSDVLQFLVPVFKNSTKCCQSNLPALSDNTEENDNTECPIEESIHFPTVEDPEPIELQSPNSERANMNLDSVTNFRKKILGKRKHNSSPLDDVMLKYFQSKTDKSNNSADNSIEDFTDRCDEQFLLSLKSDMQLMNPHQKRQFKRKIFDLIDDVLDDGSDYNAQPANTSKVHSASIDPTQSTITNTVPNLASNIESQSPSYDVSFLQPEFMFDATTGQFSVIKNVSKQ